MPAVSISEIVCPCGSTFEPLPWAAPDDDRCDECADG
jgi:hypothetical protein